MNDSENITKLFGMSGCLISQDLLTLEDEFSLDLGHITIEKARESEYYPQFEHSIRKEASEMAKYYEVFYCLEKSIRKLIGEAMEEDSEDWWACGKIPKDIFDEVKKNMKREIDAGITPRSSERLDYTTFGQLTTIFTKNWEEFEGIFSSKKAVERVLSNLNTLRAPIAHCSSFSKDEAIRLRLAVSDWFNRVMGG